MCGLYCFGRRSVNVLPYALDRIVRRSSSFSNKRTHGLDQRCYINIYTINRFLIGGLYSTSRLYFMKRIRHCSAGLIFFRIVFGHFEPNPSAATAVIV